MTDYSALSLRELKEAVASAYRRVNELEDLHAAFAETSHAFNAMGEDMNGAWLLAALGWQGQAAQAAGSAVNRNIVYYGEAHDAACASARATRRLISETVESHERMQGIEEVDTSYPAALSASGHNPFVATSEHKQRIDRANANRAQAVEQARSLDHAGRTHSTTIQHASWPRIRSDDHDAPPPRALPAPPVAPPPAPPPAPPVPPPGQPPTQPGPSPRIPTPVTTRRPGPADIATAPAAFTAPPLMPGATPGAAAAATGSGAGAAPSLGLLGGFAGGGALAGGTAGRAAGGIEPRTGGAPGEVPGETVAERPVAGRAGGPVEAAGEPMERGLFGPMGAPGGRRNGDEEHDLPDYLEDAGDLWGGEGLRGVTPVIGEDGR